MRGLPSLVGEAGTRSSDRRAFPRAEVRYPIRLEASLNTPTTSILCLDVPGFTVDVSRGGLLATLPESLAPGVRCSVSFLLDEDRVGPVRVPGMVRRLAPGGEDSLVAIEFDEALDYLDVDEKSAQGSGRRPLQLLSSVFSI